MERTIKWILALVITISAATVLAHTVWQSMSYEFLTPGGDKVWVRIDASNVLHVYYGEQNIHIGSRTDFCRQVQ